MSPQALSTQSSDVTSTLLLALKKEHREEREHNEPRGHVEHNEPRGHGVHKEPRGHVEHKEPRGHGEHKGKGRLKPRLVITESGQLCHFPFIYGRVVYNRCIRRGRNGPRLWCSLTKSFDRDQSWSYCIEGRDVKDHCDDNPCEPRGVCESKLRGYLCTCKEPYTGVNCQIDKCYDKKLEKYFEPKQTWLRYSLPNLEECTCRDKTVACKATTGIECSVDPCLNGGHCIQTKKGTTCGCIKGYKGPHCEIRSSEVCYHEKGTSFRGTANITVTGKSCLPWDSELVYNGTSLYSGLKAEAHGIGSHPYCRNPDEDSQPWCFILIEESLSWEHCQIPKCNVTTASNSPLETSTTESTTQASITAGSSSFLPENITNKPVEIRGMPVSCEKTFQKTPAASSRIVGGLVALPASHPYVAALYISSYFCGGALISSCWILTAAHCLEQGPDVKQISVVLGQTLHNTTDHRTKRFDVQRYILHENYNPDTFKNDIALVRLHSESVTCAEFSQFVQPVCLPQPSKSKESPEKCTVVGWGHQYYGAEAYALFLQEAHIPLIPYAQCKSPAVHGFKMLPGMLCAGVMAGGVDACQGDSGGPLVCEVEGQVEVHGIVSWGTGCAEENKPGVYTAVSSYLDWIRTKIQ
uniref:Coagulation factor XII n=1 Tax=Leptobrachium leishanense TaxID=445787 RepID=A0A8C5M3N7_9ANUR